VESDKFLETPQFGTMKRIEEDNAVKSEANNTSLIKPIPRCAPRIKKNIELNMDLVGENVGNIQVPVFTPVSANGIFAPIPRVPISPLMALTTTVPYSPNMPNSTKLILIT